MSNNSFAQFVQQINTMNKEQTENQVKINPKENAKWWYKLSLEEKQKAFYAVISTMYKAEVEDRGNFRHSIYDVFKFGPDMYDATVASGYEKLHNALKEDETFKDINNIQIADESGSISLDINVNGFEIDAVDNGYGSKTLRIKFTPEA